APSRRRRRRSSISIAITACASSRSEVMPSLWTPSDKLLLASKSATRLALLASAGIAVETQNSGLDERAVEAAAAQERLDPPALAQRLSDEKALAVSRRHPE